MKLLYLLDNNKLQYNREKLVCAITCPYENLDVLKEICDENGIDIKALQGMPRPLLKDDSEDIRNYTNTMKFKSCLKNAENFIFKPKPAEI